MNIPTEDTNASFGMDFFVKKVEIGQQILKLQVRDI